MNTIHETFRKHRGSEPEALIHDLNIKIKSDANPFDPEHQQYFRARRVKPKVIPVTAAEEICNEITVNFSIGKRKQPGGPRKA